MKRHNIIRELNIGIIAGLVSGIILFSYQLFLSSTRNIVISIFASLVIFLIIYLIIILVFNWISK